MSNVKKPGVGIGVIVVKENKIFLLKRQGSHKPGTWGLPGGSLEFFETWEECAKREVLEETGMEIDSLKFITAINELYLKEQKHFVGLFMAAKHTFGEGVNMEPHKVIEVGWFDKDDLPKPLFSPELEELAKNI